MKSISGKAFCKIIERQGWVLKRVSGSHHIYAKEGVQAILLYKTDTKRYIA